MVSVDVKHRVYFKASDWRSNGPGFDPRQIERRDSVFLYAQSSALDLDHVALLPQKRGCLLGTGWGGGGGGGGGGG